MNEAKDDSDLCQTFGAELELEMPDVGAGAMWHGGNMQATKPTLCSGALPQQWPHEQAPVPSPDWAARSSPGR